jgi:hypothetical protein
VNQEIQELSLRKKRLVETIHVLVAAARSTSIAVERTNFEDLISDQSDTQIKQLHK